MSSTELLPDPVTTDTGEPEVAHIAPAADVNRAYVTGEAITALCGVVFVPTRDPEPLPGLCPLQGRPRPDQSRPRRYQLTGALRSGACRL